MHVHAHGHDLSARREDSRRRIWAALAINAGMLVVEAVGGVLTGSLAVLADAGHLVSDVGALGLALLAAQLASRPGDSRRTFGYQRFEVLAATVNAVLLFVVALYILREGWHRLIEPPEIQSLAVLAIAALGLGVNLVAMRILSAGQAHSVNVRGAYLEVWSDALASVAVLRIHPKHSQKHRHRHRRTKGF